MRRHGWELPYHPLQVVAIAVFLALAFAFYVFFVPFVGAKVFQYSLVGLFSFLVTSAFSLYIWCAACDPADPAVLKSKKYVKTAAQVGRISSFDSVSRPGSVTEIPSGSIDSKPSARETRINVPPATESTDQVERNSCLVTLSYILLLPCSCFPFVQRLKSSCVHKDPSENHSCEDELLYCSLCEVEISKNSKHCRVCDKCVDGFDHHCRWLNNCIGKANYKEFFTLMIFALLLLTLQWSIGIFVLIRCFLHRPEFDQEIIARLGSSFSLGPFVVVLGCCTILAMIATLPLGQLFFFHILLVNKGISTYDYIVAMREQDQQAMGDGGQSPQMSHASSVSAFSASSSFTALHLNHASWCTPPRLFLEDQDVVPQDGSLSSIKLNSGNLSKKPIDPKVRKAKGGAVKISPWALARMNAEEVSKVASEARKKSKVVRHIPKQERSMIGLETDSSLESSSRDLSMEIRTVSDDPRKVHRPDPLSMKAASFSKPSKLGKVSSVYMGKTNHSKTLMNNMNQKAKHSSTPLAPLQQEARNAFRSSRAMSTAGLIPSSAESSLASPDVQTGRASGSGTQDLSMLSGPQLSIAEDSKYEKSTSDGYDASGGESADDSDQNSAKLGKSSWNKLLFNPTYLGSSTSVKHVRSYHTAQMPYGTTRGFDSAAQTRPKTELAATGKGVMAETSTSSRYDSKEIMPSNSDTELPSIKVLGIESADEPRKGSTSSKGQHH